jgi:hypothetical protein
MNIFLICTYRNRTTAAPEFSAPKIFRTRKKFPSRFLCHEIFRRDQVNARAPPPNGQFGALRRCGTRGCVAAFCAASGCEIVAEYIDHATGKHGDDAGDRVATAEKPSATAGSDARGTLGWSFRGSTHWPSVGRWRRSSDRPVVPGSTSSKAQIQVTFHPLSRPLLSDSEHDGRQESRVYLSACACGASRPCIAMIQAVVLLLPPGGRSAMRPEATPLPIWHELYQLLEGRTVRFTRFNRYPDR